MIEQFNNSSAAEAIAQNHIEEIEFDKQFEEELE